MTEQRQHPRSQVEFSAISRDHTGIEIGYNLGMGGCKVRERSYGQENGTLLTTKRQTPKQPIRHLHSSRPSPVDPEPRVFRVKVLELEPAGSLGSQSEHHHIGT